MVLTLALMIAVFSFCTRSSAFVNLQSRRYVPSTSTLLPLQLDVGGVEIDSGTATNAILALGLVGAGVNFFSYARLQLETAQIIGGIPRNSIVTEFDAQDGKNVFYLPPGVDYTAVMLSSGKSKEKAAINEQLILESVGKANGALASASTGGGLKGKLRAKSQEIKPKSQDVVLSIGAINRASDKALLVNEAFRILKPGGLFVFLEPGGDDVIDLIKVFFPLEIAQKSPPSSSASPSVSQATNGKSTKRRKTVASASEVSAPVETVEDVAPADDGLPQLASSTGAASKPGIVSAPVSVPLRNFITGIATRPYG